MDLQKKFTKGEWSAEEVSTHTGSFYKVFGADKTSICNVTTRNQTIHIANAKIIAASPSLLEALERVNHTLTIHGKVEADTDLHEVVLQAIKKALE